MGSLAEWYQRIPTPDDLTRVESLFANIQAQFPQLKLEFKWNQPMFTTMVRLLWALIRPKSTLLWPSSRKP